jgi:hypothetical protein
MRLSAPSLAILCLLASSVVGADVSFPYTAKVLQKEVEVRSGPGWDYYPTQRLQPGSQVEVYRHEPGGWLAIRPPRGAFSLIPARQVQQESDGRVGKVLMDAAVAWVGSDVAKVVQHKWQVRLERDELVQLLGRESLSVGPGFGTETYLRIAPPAGEFRWIHAEHASAADTPHRTRSSDVRLTDLTNDRRPAASIRPVAPKQLDTNELAAARTLDAKQLEELRQQIDQLKLELSLLVSQQIEKWNLETLRARAERIATSTKGTALARQVRLISYRIDEFESLRRRYKRASRRVPEDYDELRIGRRGVSPTPRQEPDDGVEKTSWHQNIAESLESKEPVGTGIDRLAAELGQSATPQFDAQGWLMPVHSTRRAAPPFALLDKHSRVVCYIQPAPGLNLRRYTKKHVGLFGERRHMPPPWNETLLTVTRVKRLD